MIEINLKSRRVYIDGIERRPTNLTKRGLIHFAKHPDRMFSKAQLLEVLWPDRYVVDSAVNNMVNAIRKFLGPYRECIETSYGEGFRYNPKVCEIKLTEI